MHEGNAQFLLCHQHPAAVPRLEARAFISLPQGDDVLIPVRAQSLDAALPGEETGRLPYLAYSPESGLGRIVAAARAKKDPPAWLEPVFTAHLATAIRAMAVAGRGVAWLPLTLIHADLATGRLVRAGGGDWDIPGGNPRLPPASSPQPDRRAVLGRAELRFHAAATLRR